MKVLVTAGPTREHVDDIRFLTNASSGRMGFAVARAARDAGHEVVVVAGPTPLDPPDGLLVRRVTTAVEMRDAVLEEHGTTDLLFGVAAVADYRPEERIPGKRKKRDGPWDLRLVRNPDILAEVGASKGERVHVGFALEASDEAEKNALRKLADKNLDLIVLNAPKTVGADHSDFLVLDVAGARTPYISVTKDFLAQRLVSLAAEARLSPGR